MSSATLSLNRQRWRNKDIPWEPVRKSMRCMERELWAFRFAAKGGRRWSSSSSSTFDGFIPVWTHSRTPTPLITSGDLAASLGGVIVEKLCHNKGNRKERAGERPRKRIEWHLTGCVCVCMGEVSKKTIIISQSGLSCAEGFYFYFLQYHFICICKERKLIKATKQRQKFFFGKVWIKNFSKNPMSQILLIQTDCSWSPPVIRHTPITKVIQECRLYL